MKTIKELEYMQSLARLKETTEGMEGSEEFINFINETVSTLTAVMNATDEQKDIAQQKLVDDLFNYYPGQLSLYAEAAVLMVRQATLMEYIIELLKRQDSNKELLHELKELNDKVYNNLTHAGFITLGKAINSRKAIQDEVSGYDD